MKKIYLTLLIVFTLVATPAMAATKKAVSTPAKPVYKATAPKDYLPITWASAPGITSFFRAPKNSGTIDFLTRIYLPQNQINFILATSTPIDLSLANQLSNSQNATSSQDIKTNSTIVTNDLSAFHNLSFQRFGAEIGKTIDPTIKFLFDVAFFNMKSPFSDLSMAAKYSVGGTTTITSGSRSVPDMEKPRRMLIINNQTGKAMIKDFDSAAFIDNKNGDQAIEGFDPTVAKTDTGNGGASRLFLGVSSDGQELTVYCSQLATVQEASDALTAAGISPDNQFEADGGGSASCGYNLPGQFFVEPMRTLPLLMGAKTIVARGKVTTDNINVRKGPSTKNPIVMKLAKGTAVQAYEEKNGWYRIGDGEWILKTLIK